jgi:hypothetical protein
MFTVIPNLFSILGLCVTPEKDNSQTLITISDSNADKKSASKTSSKRTDRNAQSLREEKYKKEMFSKYIKRNEPNHKSARAVKWVIVVVWVAFCGVFLYCAINPPREPLAMLYSLLSLSLGGFAAFFRPIVKSIVPMFDKHVEKEEDILIQILK